MTTSAQALKRALLFGWINVRAGNARKLAARAPMAGMDHFRPTYALAVRLLAGEVFELRDEVSADV